MNKTNRINLFGIKFIDAKYKYIKSLLDKGGLLVLPSGPGLSTINTNIKYYDSLKNADIALFDSGYLCLLLKILKGVKVKKFSGLKFLNKFLINLSNKNNHKLFLINPSLKDAKINMEYLKSKKIINVNQHIARIYKKNKIHDSNLVKKINKYRPKYIIINLGGGVQEILGCYLKNKLNYKPSIICSGAALSFLTKQQAPISDVIDKIYLGWFLRIIFNPIKFLPRYLLAFRLFFLIKQLKLNFNNFKS